MNDDAVLAVANALTGVEASQIQATWFRLNPAWRGAGVADIFEALYESDAWLVVTEALYAEHGDEVPEPGLLAVAAFAAIYMTPLPLGVTATAAGVWPIAAGIIDRVRSAST